jgi:hypothetical protein
MFLQDIVDYARNNAEQQEDEQDSCTKVSFWFHKLSAVNTITHRNSL